MKGIRGAICATANTREAILQATQSLLRHIMARNGLAVEDIVVALFTMTPDLDADFPAHAARDMGWTAVPMLGAQETSVPGAHARAIRVLVLARGEGPPRHVYLGEAADMRPDLTGPDDMLAATDGPTVVSEPRAGGAGRLVIIGLGLIGGSLAAAARAAGVFSEVRGVERSPEVRRHALERGIIDGVGELAEEVQHADLIVLAVSVSQIVRLLPTVGQLVCNGAVVTDVGSTKRRIVEMMNTLPEHVRALGGHPMAGTTRRGPNAWSSGLFRGSRWALVPTLRTDGRTRACVESLVRAVGARPVEIDAPKHDRMVAVTSHLPALLSVALTEAAREQADLSGPEGFLFGPGLGSATRLAASAPDLLCQIFRENRDYLAEAVIALETRVREIQALIREGEGELERRLEGARRTRAAVWDDLAG